MTPRALQGLAFLVAALLAVVILVGLAQSKLDVTGVAVTLCTVLTGIVGGTILRSNDRNNRRDDWRDRDRDRDWRDRDDGDDR